MGSCFLTSCQIGNMKGVCVYVASILLGLTVIVNCSEESRLKRHLLFEYDRNTKPSEQVVVEIGMRPTNLNLCPHSQTLTLQSWNTYKWKDSRLAWTPTDWNNITTLKFSRHDTIWVPDVFVFKIVDEVKQFGDFQYIVSSDGSVLYIPIEIHKIFCAVNYDNYLSELKLVNSRLDLGNMMKVILTLKYTVVQLQNFGIRITKLQNLMWKEKKKFILNMVRILVLQWTSNSSVRLCIITEN